MRRAARTAATLLGLATGWAEAIVSTSASTSLLGSSASFLDGIASLTITRSDTSGAVGCSGSLVGGGAYILTAAHCLSGDTGTATTTSITASFLGGKVSVTSTSYVVNSGWNGTFTAGNDLAVIRLSSALTSVTSYDLYTSASALGSEVVLAGYGYTGTGSAGYTSGTFGTLHYGYNEYDTSVIGRTQYAATYLYDFDDGSTGFRSNNRTGGAGLGSLEAMIAPGDSGGGTLAYIDGEWVLIGVHSFMTCQTPGCTVNSSFGTIGGDISVYGNASWLSSVIVAVPEPGMAGMLLAGLLLVGSAVRRRADRHQAL